MAVPCAAVASGDGNPRDWLCCLHDLDAAARIGARLQSGSVRNLSAAPLTNSFPLGGQPSPEQLRSIIADEFRSGRTVLLDGVVFSHTEIRLYDQAYRARFGA
jgi:hypothetical protein